MKFDVRTLRKILPHSKTEDLKSAEKVTYDDVVKFTKQIFNPEWIFTEVILPTKKN